MGPMKNFVIVIFLILLLEACQGTANWLRADLFKATSIEKRSMSDIIVDVLDYVFPKDDSETSIMKEIFTMFAEEGPPGLEGGLSALDYLID